MAKYCPQKQNYALYLDCKECTEKWCDSFFCLVVGSRDFNDYSLLKTKLDYYLKNQPNVVIVSGGAKGADSLAEQYAHERNLPLVIFKAEWEKLGKRAGYIRNEQMHQYISKMPKRGCIAFWNGKSKGTQHNFELSEKYKNPIRIILV